MAKINDLTKENWKGAIEYADSLWTFSRDIDTSQKKKGFYGGFIGQVALGLIIRYTKPGDWVLDMFGGSGTTERAAAKLGRSSFLTDIQYPRRSTRYISRSGSIHLKVYADACSSSKYPHIPPISLAILHPPYFNIIKYSNKSGDLSNMDNSPAFRNDIHRASKIAVSKLVNNGHIALVFGDVYKEGELIPAHLIAETITRANRDLTMKAIFIKDIQGNEAGKGKNTNLHRYRGLVNGYAVFKHEYLYVWRKK